MLIVILITLMDKKPQSLPADEWRTLQVAIQMGRCRTYHPSNYLMYANHASGNLIAEHNDLSQRHIGRSPSVVLGLADYKAGAADSKRGSKMPRYPYLRLNTEYLRDHNFGGEAFAYEDGEFAAISKSHTQFEVDIFFVSAAMMVVD